MADGKVTFTIEGKDEGNSLKKTADKTKKLGKEIKNTGRNYQQAGKNADAYHKTEKSMYTTTLNSTKAFSKQAQSIGGGSSGLVGAYATLAANVFAASAAFQFLRNAARFDILAEGLEELGNQSGRTLSIVANSLREVTGNAISAEESLRSAALGISGGFGQTELEGLAKIAKGASIALGRDLGDAFDRLTRGAIKLEPEILDELGIMVRLDDAVENYAVVLGKSASQLTQLERRQAFMNAILEQGSIKFGNIAEKVDNNPYDRLAAAFRDLTKDIGKFSNIFIIPFIELLAENMGILIASSLLLASTFAKQMIPSLLKGGEAAEAASLRLGSLADQQRRAAAEAVKRTVSSLTGTIGPKDAQNQIKLIKESNGQLRVQNDLIKQLQRSQRAYQVQIDKGAAFGKDLTNKEIQQKREKLALLDAEILKLKQLQVAQNIGFTSSVAANTADIRGLLSGSIGDILTDQSGRTPMESIKGLPDDFKRLSVEAGAAFSLFKDGNDTIEEKGGKVGKLSKLFGNLKLGITTAGGAVRLFGAALLNAIPVIGQIIFGISLLVQFYKKITFDEKQEEINKKLEDYETILDGVVGKTEEYNRVLAKVDDPFLRITQSFTIASGLIDETVTKLEELIKLQNDYTKGEKDTANLEGTFSFSTMDANLQLYRQANENAIKEQERFATAMNTANLEAFTFVKRQDLMKSPIMQQLLTLREEGPKIVNDILDNSLDLDDLIEAGDNEALMAGVLEALKKTKEALKDTGPALKDLEAAFKESEKVFSGFLNAAFPKTKWDQTTESIKATTNSLASAIQNVAKSYGQELGNIDLSNLDFSNFSDELISQVGATLEGVGPTLEKFIPTKFADAGTKLNQSLERRDTLAASITEKEENLSTLTGVALERAQQELILLETKLKTENEIVDANKNLIQGRAAAIKKIETDLTKLQESARTLKSSNDIIANRIKLLSKAVKFGDALEYSLEQQNSIHEANAAQLKREIEIFEGLYNASVKNGEADIEIAQYLFKLRSDLKKQQDSILTVEQIELKVKRAKIKLAQEELKYEKERREATATVLENETKLRNFRTGAALELNTQQTFEQELQAAKDKRDLALEEAKIKFELLDIEKEVTAARLTLLAAELRKAGKENDAVKLEAAAARANTNITRAQTSMQATINAIRSSFEVEITSAFSNSLSSTNMGYVFENLAQVVAERSANAFQAARDKVLGEGGTQDEANKAGETAKKEAEKLTLGDFKSVASPMIEELKKLGPEGEYVAAATEGIFSIASAFASLNDGAITAGDAVNAAMTIMSSVNNVMQSYSKARIAEIDKQIEAEQRRDGKSKESLQRIQQMQKKKDEIGRKAFEMDKKMKIATTIMNTATGIMQAYANYEPITATILSAMIGALGMAQIGIIKKTQYQSTASDTGPSANTALTIGKRSNAVDVSKQATGGELNYIRGGSTSGTNLGGAGAAMGRKGYANGGEGVVVGERGPEIITPADPVDITPNFALGGETNVNFTINAVDAAGVEDLLVNQRGNIIRMIREAANENGEDFLTQVDPMAYGSKS